MLTCFGTLFATWHIYHYLTLDVSRGTLCTVAQISLHNCANRQQATRCFTWNDETVR